MSISARSRQMAHLPRRVSPPRASPRRASQRGASLLVVTLLATLVGLIAVSQVSSLMGLFRTARDERDLTLARQAAEAALRDAEADVACMKRDPDGTWKQVVVPDTNNNHCVSVAPHCSQMMPTANARGIRLLGANPAATPAAVDWSAPLCSEDSCAVVELGAKTGAPAFAGVALQPRYQVDAFDVSTSGSGEPVPLFRITARGYGGTADTVSELQEVYRPCR